LVLGHAQYKGVQRVYCNPFPKKMFYGSHRMDPVIIPFPKKMFYRKHRMNPVIIRPPGIDNGAFVVLPETV
jgi:hypothetical protein